MVGEWLKKGKELEDQGKGAEAIACYGTINRLRRALPRRGTLKWEFWKRQF